MKFIIKFYEQYKEEFYIYRNLTFLDENLETEVLVD